MNTATRQRIGRAWAQHNSKMRYPEKERVWITKQRDQAWKQDSRYGRAESLPLPDSYEIFTKLEEEKESKKKLARSVDDELQEFMGSPASSIFLENLLNAGMSPAINPDTSEDEGLRTGNGNGSYKTGFCHDGARQQPKARKIRDQRTPKRHDNEFSLGFRPTLSYGSQQHTQSSTFWDFYVRHEDPEEAHAAFLDHQAELQQREAINERYHNLADSFADRLVQKDIQGFDAYKQKEREEAAAVARRHSQERNGNGAEQHAGTSQQGSNGANGNGTLQEAVESNYKPKPIKRDLGRQIVNPSYASS